MCCGVDNRVDAPQRHVETPPAQGVESFGHVTALSGLAGDVVETAVEGSGVQRSSLTAVVSIASISSRVLVFGGVSRRPVERADERHGVGPQVEAPTAALLPHVAQLCGGAWIAVGEVEAAVRDVDRDGPRHAACQSTIPVMCPWRHNTSRDGSRGARKRFLDRGSGRETSRLRVPTPSRSAPTAAASTTGAGSGGCRRPSWC